MARRILRTLPPVDHRLVLRSRVMQCRSARLILALHRLLLLRSRRERSGRGVELLLLRVERERRELLVVVRMRTRVVLLLMVERRRLRVVRVDRC